MPWSRLGCVRITEELLREGLNTGRLQRTVVCVLGVSKALTDNVWVCAEAARRSPVLVGAALEAVPAGGETHAVYPSLFIAVG